MKKKIHSILICSMKVQYFKQKFSLNMLTIYDITQNWLYEIYSTYILLVMKFDFKESLFPKTYFSVSKLNQLQLTNSKDIIFSVLGILKNYCTFTNLFYFCCY